uniref:ATP-dependent DNA helicase II subunit 2 n=2 Tax=Caenorhabditis japonica TaxID=281687 RepID=A0A8R1HZB4_CAEJA
MPPKKSPGITAVLIDAGPNMAEKDEESGKSFFEQAINTADWIVSRKLFSEDPENFAIIAYNSDPDENIIKLDGEKFKGVKIHSEEFEPACFDHLRFITKELELNTGNFVENCFFKGVLASVSLLKSVLKSSPNPSGITLIVLTNGKNENLRQENYDLLVDAITEVNTDLMVIGIPENNEYPAFRICEFVEAVEGRSYTFENVSRMLSNYQARQKSERKFNKMWDIAPGIRLPVTIALKSEKSSALLKFKNVDLEGDEMVRIEQMHVESSTDEDVKPNNAKVVEKDAKVMHGYNFGKSLIMMDPEYLIEKYNNHNFNEGQTGGVLKLIQFTKRANILDSYLLDASAKTVLPSVNTSPRVIGATISLIEAMMSLRVAAICRFTFHAKSHVQLVALLPHKDEETRVLYLRSVKLPFSDDMRTLKFPKFSFEEEEEDSRKPTVAQLSAVDDLIDSMQLGEGEISNLVEGGMSDPKLQMQCQFLKNLVLRPEDSLEVHSSRNAQFIDKIMAPKKIVEEKNVELFQRLSREFSLQPVIKTKRERVQVEAEDLENIIEEWREKKKSKTSESGGDGKKKKKLTRKEELNIEMDEDAQLVCSKMLQMISSMCKFQQNGTVSGFFQILLTELQLIRSVSIEKSKCEEFNELLKKLKDEEDFEPFSEFLAEEKSCNPIGSSEVAKSQFSDQEADEFWEE